MQKSQKASLRVSSHLKGSGPLHGKISPSLTYCAVFLGLVLGFSLLSLFPVYREIQRIEATWSAHVAHRILYLFSPEFATVSESTLFRGSIAILEVKPNCSVLHYIWLLTSAMIAYPAPWILRLAGIAGGFLILLASNILRIVCLFLIGCFFPGWFDPVHEHYWPVFSLLLTIVVMAIWILFLPPLKCPRK
jgi:exosortase/archaeosortase family protein